MRSKPAPSLEFAGFDFVDIAPNPGFSGLNRADEWVLGRVKMLSGMFVLGRIAAAYMSADKTEAQVDPGIAHFHALPADVDIGLFEFDLVQVGTFLRHRSLHIREA
jgi:hypothetical protein